VFKDLKVLVCGGRNYSDGKRVFSILSEIHKKERRILTIIHGGATGADTLAGEWAAANEVIAIRVPAQWSVHGRSAGPKRNDYMLREFKPDLVVAFPGGDGTADMVGKAECAGIEIDRVSR
jgi:hypothetical protein